MKQQCNEMASTLVIQIADLTILFLCTFRILGTEHLSTRLWGLKCLFSLVLLELPMVVWYEGFGVGGDMLSESFQVFAS